MQCVSFCGLPNRWLKRSEEFEKTQSRSFCNAFLFSAFFVSFGHSILTLHCVQTAGFRRYQALSVDRYQARNSRELSRISSDVIFLRSIFLPTNHFNAAVPAIAGFTLGLTLWASGMRIDGAIHDNVAAVFRKTWPPMRPLWTPKSD